MLLTELGMQLGGQIRKGCHAGWRYKWETDEHISIWASKVQKLYITWGLSVDKNVRSSRTESQEAPILRIQK